MGKLTTNYIYYKVQRGEVLGVMSICKVVGQHEATTPTDAIQAVMFLPEVATRLDTQMSMSSNVEDLVISASKLDRNRGEATQRKGVSPARHHSHQSGNPGPAFRNYYKSPQGGKYFRRSTSKDKSSGPSRSGPSQQPRSPSDSRFLGEENICAPQ